MALIDCPKCGKQVSDRAPACPHCGTPVAQTGPSDESPQQQKQPEEAGQNEHKQPEQAERHRREQPEETESGCSCMTMLFIASIIFACFFFFKACNRHSGSGEPAPEEVLVDTAVRVDYGYSEPVSVHPTLIEVTGQDVRFRHEPKPQGQIYTGNNGSPICPNAGERFAYIDESGDYYAVSYNGLTLYISKRDSRPIY